MNRRDVLTLGAIATVVGGCTPLPPGVRAPTELWAIWSSDSKQVRSSDGFSAIAETWIALDSVSFRPTVISFVAPRDAASGQQSPATPSSPRSARRLSVITSFQGSRYHPDVIRGLTESSDAVAVTAGSIASLLASSPAEGVILDFQEMTAADLQILMDVSRAIADSARAHSAAPITMMIPAADSSGYPARILARVADLLLIRLFPEHGVTTPAGPIVSPSWFTRRLGQRTGEAGVNRIVAGIPADGIIWDNRGARRISYLDAVRLAREANTPIIRDPASGNLHAVSSRDGWEVWVADHELIERLIEEGRRIGVTRFALFGLEGADPQLLEFVREGRAPDR
ncbi:MAG TPA: twin-arginine translocation signal domain-containing protein [Gemmatimonadaceae bacterium]|nr:twin-arginine translocation signal domain-containing protein [Gemmatimonadaceae bacterium]